MAERVATVVVMGFSIYIFVKSLDLDIGNSTNPGSGFMPILASLFVIALSLVVLIKGVIGINKKKVRSATASFSGLVKPVILVSGIFVYSLLFQALGFLLASLPLMYLMFSITKPKDWRTNLFVSVVMVMSSYFLFRSLGVLLPIGILGIGW